MDDLRLEVADKTQNAVFQFAANMDPLEPNTALAKAGPSLPSGASTGRPLFLGVVFFLVGVFLLDHGPGIEDPEF